MGKKGTRRGLPASLGTLLLARRERKSGVRARGCAASVSSPCGLQVQWIERRAAALLSRCLVHSAAVAAVEVRSGV